MANAPHDDKIIGWIAPRFEAIGLALKINKSTVLTHPECLICFSTIQRTSVGTEIFESTIGTHDDTHQHLHRKCTEHTGLLFIISFLNTQHG